MFRNKLLAMITLCLLGAIAESISAADLLKGAAAGRVKVVDLTYALNAGNPYWPGPDYKPFHYEIFATLEKNGVLSGRFEMAEHSGTHLDAPNHFAKGQISVDAIPLRQLIGEGIVIDASQECSKNADFQLSSDDILKWEKKHGRIPAGAIVFLYTGWGKYWNDYARYKNQDSSGALHFPGFAPEAARLLVMRNVSGLGIDTLSVDYGLSKTFDVHHITHPAGKYHIENAAHLDRLPPRGVMILVAPIKIDGGTGGPARVLAFLP